MSTNNLQNAPNIKKKLRGYLYGTACADALGRPVEHLTLEQIKGNMEKKESLNSRPILPGLMIPS